MRWEYSGGFCGPRSRILLLVRSSTLLFADHDIKWVYPVHKSSFSPPGSPTNSAEEPVFEIAYIVYLLVYKSETLSARFKRRYFSPIIISRCNTLRSLNKHNNWCTRSKISTAPHQLQTQHIRTGKQFLQFFRQQLRDRSTFYCAA